MQYFRRKSKENARFEENTVINGIKRERCILYSSIIAGRQGADPY